MKKPYPKRAFGGLSVGDVIASIRFTMFVFADSDDRKHVFYFDSEDGSTVFTSFSNGSAILEHEIVFKREEATGSE